MGDGRVTDERQAGRDGAGRRPMARLSVLFREVLKRRVVRDGGWLALSQLASLVARMLGLRLITELTPPGVYAEIALLLGGTASFGSDFYVFGLSEEERMR